MSLDRLNAFDVLQKVFENMRYESKVLLGEIWSKKKSTKAD